MSLIFLWQRWRVYLLNPPCRGIKNAIILESPITSQLNCSYFKRLSTVFVFLWFSLRAYQLSKRNRWINISVMKKYSFEIIWTAFNKMTPTTKNTWNSNGFNEYNNIVEIVSSIWQSKKARKALLLLSFSDLHDHPSYSHQYYDIQYRTLSRKIGLWQQIRMRHRKNWRRNVLIKF